MATAPAATSSTTIRGLPRPLARAMEAYAGRLDVAQIRDAHQLAAEAHSGQIRASGASFVSHAVEVATILAQLRLDSASIAAGLIHDVVEDTAVDLTDVESRFGAEVATIVDGVTKIGRVRFRSHTEHQVENYRKLLLSMAQDARVILIKLADRLHNMRTLEHLPPAKQRRIALETRDIYAPLAHRLGVAAIKWELEDLAFKFLEPEAYKELRRKIHQRRREREREILEVKRPLEEILTEAEIPYEVTGPSQASLVHLQEDDRPAATVRGDIRLDGPPGHYGLRAKLLRGPGHHPQPLDACAGPVSRLHRDPEVQHVSIATYDGIRAGWSPVRDPDPDGGDAPDSGSKVSRRIGDTRRGDRSKGTRSTRRFHGSARSSSGKRTRTSRRSSWSSSGWTSSKARSSYSHRRAR